VMADGDLTYDPQSAPEMVRRLLDEQLDMVVGTRRHEAAAAYREALELVGSAPERAYLQRMLGSVEP